MRRPSVRTVAVVVAAVIAVGTVGLGLGRAALYQPSVGASPGPVVLGDSCGGLATTAPHELRGMWLTTVENIDFPSRPGLSEAQVKAEYEGWLDLAVAQNHNAIFVHVRPSGDAFWPSEFAPWSEFLTGKRDGKSPGWDPMAFMVDEAHKRNLEFHAWFNPYRGTQPAPSGPGADFAKLAPDNPLLKHRDWVIAYPKGKAARLYYDPGNPAARAYIEESMMEAVTKYDIDGVHFDDFFYPYPVAGQDFPDDASFAERADKSQSRAAWRRANVDTLIREMNQKIKAAKPWVEFGISPFGIWRNKSTDPRGSDTAGLQSYDAIYADTRKWVQNHWVDYIVPQLYWAIGFAKADYAKLLPWWSDLVKGTGVQLYIGQGDYRVGEAGAWSDPAELDRQMTLNQRYAVSGSIHFSAKQVAADRLGAVTRYRQDHYATPALLPPMPQLPHAIPGRPLLTAAHPVGDNLRLDWQPGAGPAAVSWALYQVTGTSAILAGTGRADQPVVAVGSGSYCLSALDRSGDESPPSPIFTARR